MEREEGECGEDLGFCRGGYAVLEGERGGGWLG